MPIQLAAENFSEDKLPVVASLNCGNDEWGNVANDWIKCSSAETALTAIRDKQTQVLLYFNQGDGSLVGFGSLGLAQRKLAGIVHDFSIIPHIGLDVNYHGCPKGEPWEQRCSTLIMRDLINRAGQLPPDKLMLFVNQDNVRARKLYDKLGFVCLGPVNTKGNQPMAIKLR